MEILAVIIGYILGSAPFVVPKIIEMIKNRTKKQEEVEEDKTQQDIIDEWVNGPKKINQQDLYNEYMTGEETMKGE